MHHQGRRDEASPDGPRGSHRCSQFVPCWQLDTTCISRLKEDGLNIARLGDVINFVRRGGMFEIDVEVQLPNPSEHGSGRASL